MRTSPASGPVTGPRTWPSSATSPSTSYAKRTTSDPSSDGESGPHGTRSTSSKSSAHCAVNLDSLPWSEIARKLQIGRSTLYRKLKELGFENSDKPESIESVAAE